MARIKSCEGGGADPPPMNEKAAPGLGNPSAAHSQSDTDKASKAKDTSPPRVVQARRSLLHGFIGEQLHAIATGTLAAVYHAANDDGALSYLGKRIAAHARALEATADDLAAIAEGGAPC
jgi:hypothetical protein